MSTNVAVFSGQAGTGKTTKLIESLKTFIEGKEWRDYESILAITFMHGSRKRLEPKLNFIKKNYSLKYSCTTIDSFALSILNRFRTYLGINTIIYANVEETDSTVYKLNEIESFYPLNKIKEECISLLEKPSIISYIHNSYPIIIIDEFQDCSGNLLEIIKRLSSITKLLIATDPFQQLLDPEEPDGNDWIQTSNFSVTNLDNKIWRTNNYRLLNSAKSLRIGTSCTGEKIRVYARQNAKSVSSKITEYIFYWLAKGKNIAIIYPSKSDFVINSINGLTSSHEFKYGTHKGKVVGPYHLLVTSINKTDAGIIAKKYAIKDLSKNELKKLLITENYIIRKASSVALRKLALRNESKINSNDFKEIISQMCHTYDNYISHDYQSSIISTTVHGAKNREFDYVIVIWPYRVSGDNLFKRKLLYNAITRARISAIVIVQYKNINTEELKSHEIISLLLN